MLYRMLHVSHFCFLPTISFYVGVWIVTLHLDLFSLYYSLSFLCHAFEDSDTQHVTKLGPQHGRCQRRIIAFEGSIRQQFIFLFPMHFNSCYSIEDKPSADLQLLSTRHILWKYLSIHNKARILKYWRFIFKYCLSVTILHFHFFYQLLEYCCRD